MHHFQWHGLLLDRPQCRWQHLPAKKKGRKKNYFSILCKLTTISWHWSTRLPENFPDLPSLYLSPNFPSLFSVTVKNTELNWPKQDWTGVKAEFDDEPKWVDIGLIGTEGRAIMLCSYKHITQLQNNSKRPQK